MSSLPVSSLRQRETPRPEVSLAACSVILPDRDIVVPAAAHTLAGFRAWAKSDDFPQRGRISFIDSEIVIDMSGEELETHGKVKLEMARVLANLNRKQKRGELYPDGTLVTNVEANLSTEPDGTFVTWEALETGRARLIPREGEQGQYLEVEGTPDWVMEILSNSSVRKDTVRLRERYHRAGISEYWLIDARGEDLDFQILVRGEVDYVPVPRQGDWQVSRVFGRRFRLVRQRGRMNHWQYTLESKPLR